MTVNFWVFTIGTSAYAPPVDWLAQPQWRHHASEMWFPGSKRPVAIRAGDRAVIYGSHRLGFVAAVEVVSDEPEENDKASDPEERARYPWRTRHRLLVSKAADKHVASPEDAGLKPRRIVRGPHTRIEPEEYQRAVSALLSAAARTAAP